MARTPQYQKLFESRDVTRIYSVADQLPPGTPLIRHRPFRAPHHTISHAGLVGGGTIPHPGEISLAHRGVLFLDEFPEFGSRVLEVMRQPMEDKVVIISRAKGSFSMSKWARFHLQKTTGGRDEPLPVQLFRRFPKALYLRPFGCYQVPKTDFRPPA
jgi:predicted ATPase with chaperone activity